MGCVRRCRLLSVLCCLMPAVAAQTTTPVPPGFERAAEPKERAFTFVKPQGWLIDGGILRLPPDTAGAMNAVNAKLDMSVKRDAAGTVMIRWLPDLFFIDVRNSPVATYYVPNPGTVFNNCLAMPKLGPIEFLSQLAFRQVHPQAQSARAMEQHLLPDLATQYTESSRRMNLPMTYAAGLLITEYQEGQQVYRELMFGVIEDMTSGLWRNRDCFIVRAPAAEFGQWLKALGAMAGSLEFNQEWLVGELRESAKRAQVLLGVQQDLQRLDAEICDNRRQVNADINRQIQKILIKQDTGK